MQSDVVTVICINGDMHNSDGTDAFFQCFSKKDLHLNTAERYYTFISLISMENWVFQ